MIQNKEQVQLFFMGDKSYSEAFYNTAEVRQYIRDCCTVSIVFLPTYIRKRLYGYRPHIHIKELKTGRQIQKIWEYDSAHSDWEGDAFIPVYECTGHGHMKAYDSSLFKAIVDIPRLCCPTSGQWIWIVKETYGWYLAVRQGGKRGKTHPYRCMLSRQYKTLNDAENAFLQNMFSVVGADCKEKNKYGCPNCLCK